MGVIRSLFTGKPDPVVATAIERSTSQAPVFTTIVDSGTLYGVQTLDEAMRWTQGHTRITRREAISVPAVKAARDKIAGGLGQLPLRVLDAQNRDGSATFSPSIFPQAEEGIASTVTWTNVVDDLLFSKYAYLLVTNTSWHYKPSVVVRLDPETVTYRPDLRVFQSTTGNGSAQQWPADSQIIRIESPNDPLLVAGARAIRMLGRLEAAALNSAEGVPPNDFFTPAEGVDPFDPTDPDDRAALVQMLDDWQSARLSRSTGYVPAALKYNTNAWSPEQLQLVEARAMAIGEIARLTGLDADELGLAVSTRTYANMQDRRRQFLDFTLGPYMRAIETRLSMDDVTPRGYKVRFDTDDFTKADDKTTAETDEVLIRSGVLTVNEVRARRGLEALAEPPAPAPAIKAPETEEASA